MDKTQTTNAQPMATPAEMIEGARALYRQGRVAESEAAFKAASLLPASAAEGLYGIGLCRLSGRDHRGAEELFRRSLSADPAYVNSLYQLGVIAEREGRAQEARTNYGRVLKAQPAHAGARAALNRLVAAEVGNRPAPPPDTPDGPPVDTRRESRYGVYKFLLDDKFPLSPQTVAVMDDVRLDVRPRLAAHLTSLVGVTSLASAVAVVAGALSGARPLVLGDFEVALTGGAAIAVALVALLVLVYSFLRITTMRIAVDRGRLQVEKGVVARTKVNVELWRVEDIELRQNALQRLTGDGTLVFKVARGDPKKPLEVTGVAHGQALRDLHQKLLNLTFLMRGNPVVKGIIT